MTVKLGSYTFANEPQIDFDLDAKLSEKPKFGGGTTRDYTGHGDLRITLAGKLTGSSCYSDRDTLLGLLKGGAKVDFYADTVGYGSAGSPRSVWIRKMGFGHPVGRHRQVPFTITLVEET